ncbi:hypothetical protein CPAR01_07123 [Colletotrichum paranaense]|uniref:Uncharacterized protein n=1 Tax=Colletotrichum paranaense TaxID=1914294 RepID=A0ABQ9SPH3_9PEZI|nr:uncharacterized protein CPAR01_07123 [Colletotrichum paranaense]KAK1541134.1 hypothetical protein CPAR01_07123 [Colletotrichum paranaense]
MQSHGKSKGNCTKMLRHRDPRLGEWPQSGTARSVGQSQNNSLISTHGEKRRKNWCCRFNVDGVRKNQGKKTRSLSGAPFFRIGGLARVPPCRSSQDNGRLKRRRQRMDMGGGEELGIAEYSFDSFLLADDVLQDRNRDEDVSSGFAYCSPLHHGYLASILRVLWEHGSCRSPICAAVSVRLFASPQKSALYRASAQSRMQLRTSDKPSR